MKTIICHSFPAWDTPYVKSTVELMKRLSGQYRVIFVDYHYTWKDLFSNPSACWKRLLGIQNRWRQINTRFGTIEVYQSPPVLPINWVNQIWLFRLLAMVNAFLVKGTIHRVNKRVNPEDTVLVNAFNPVYGKLTHKAWQVSRTVYYCYDEISGTEWSGKWGARYEQEYLKMVDQVICSSSQLQRVKGVANPNCTHVPNGVDLTVFDEAPLTKTKNQVIGYIGALDNRIDTALIHEMAKKLPGYEFQLVGPIKSSVLEKELDSLPNVKLLGSKPQSDLPAYIAEMDLCIIPFVKNSLTAAIYPLKINEYLAMGKPVISTDFSDLSDFSGFVSIAESKEAFIQAIQRELKGNTRLRIQKRISFAKKNGWESRAESFARLIA